MRQYLFPTLRFTVKGSLHDIEYPVLLGQWVSCHIWPNFVPLFWIKLEYSSCKWCFFSNSHLHLAFYTQKKQVFKTGLPPSGKIRENQGKFWPSGKSGKVREFQYFLSRVRENKRKNASYVSILFLKCVYYLSQKCVFYVFLFKHLLFSVQLFFYFSNLKIFLTNSDPLPHPTTPSV